MTSYRHHFLLDPDVIFLNHGSFGATPRPVFETYQYWQRQLENQPVQFLEHQLPPLLADARQALGDLVNASAADLVFIPHATFGVNVVANSLELAPGDEVLSTDHEYGACVNVWSYHSARKGYHFINQPISLAESFDPTREPWRKEFSQSPTPIPQSPAIIDQLWSGVTSRTKAIFISHITSSTAQLWPVQQICSRAAAAGILTIIDGAHATGQIDLDLQALGVDFYIGNCHKWLCAPKGSAFLFTRKNRQPLIEPLVIGWGWGDDRTFSFGSDYLDYLQWLGTDDLAAYLAVPAAIQFQEDNDWPAVRQRCQELAFLAAQRIGRLFGPSAQRSGLPDNRRGHLRGEANSIAAKEQSLSGPKALPPQALQMAIAPLPQTNDLRDAQRSFYQRYKIEVPFIQWRDQQLIRVSVQGYNNQSDVDALIEALAEYFEAPS